MTITAAQSNQPPVARFTFNCVGQTNPNQCAFNASTSTDDHGIVSYTWAFGDGSSATGVRVSHTYPAGAKKGGGTNYTVTLTITDTAGQTATITKTVKA